MKKLAIAMSSVVVLAASVTEAAGYLTSLGQGVAVNSYLMHSGGGMTIWVSGISNPDGCGGTDKVHLKGDLSGHKQMIATVIAASVSGRHVGFQSNSAGFDLSGRGRDLQHVEQCTKK